MAQINITAGTVNLINDTLTLNTADIAVGNTGGGGGIAVNGGQLNMLNDIVSGNADNFAIIKRPDIAGTITSGAANLIGNLIGVTGAPASDVTGNPLFFSTPDYFSGVTKSFAILPGSPVIGNGVPSSGTLTAPPLDQRGNPRIKIAGHVDIGSFETKPFNVSLASTSVQNQRTLVSTQYDLPLAVSVTSNDGYSTAGGIVTLTAPPATSASVVFSQFGADPITPITIGTNVAALVTIVANQTASATVTANSFAITGSLPNHSFAVPASLVGSASFTFNLTNQVVTTLDFSLQQPTDTKSGLIINSAATPTGVQARLLDQDGLVVSKATNNVTLKITGATQLTTNDIVGAVNNLKGPKQDPGNTSQQRATAVGGIVSFPGITIDHWGRYTFSVSTPATPTANPAIIYSVPDGTSTAFNILASQLVFAPSNTTQVRSGNNSLIGADLASSQFQIVVNAEDDTNAIAQNYDSTSNSNDSVTLSVNTAMQDPIDIWSVAAAGSVSLAYNGTSGTAAPLNSATVTAAQVQTYLGTIASLPANSVTVSGNVGGPFYFTFAGNVSPALDASKLTLSGPGTLATQNVVLSLTPAAGQSAGRLTVSYNGVSAGGFDFDSAASVASALYPTSSRMQSYLSSIPALSGKVTVTGNPGGPFYLALAGGLDASLLTNSGNGIVNPIGNIKGKANLAGTLVAPASKGVATFSNLLLDKWGYYTLNAVQTPKTPVPTNVPTAAVPSAQITVTPYAARHHFHRRDFHQPAHPGWRQREDQG